MKPTLTFLTALLLALPAALHAADTIPGVTLESRGLPRVLYNNDSQDLEVPSMCEAGESPAAWWAFDEGAGQAVADSSGHGNHGKLSGKTAWVAGRHRNAVQFTAGTISVPDNDSLDFGTNAFSIAAWVKTSRTSMGVGTEGQIVRDGGGADGAGYIFGLKSGRLRALIQDSDGHAVDDEEVHGPIVWDGYWHHVAVVFDRTNRLTFYKDGVAFPGKTITSVSGSVSNAKPKHIGSHNGTEQFLDGALDDVRIYNRALTEANILDVMGNPQPNHRYKYSARPLIVPDQPWELAWPNNFYLHGTVIKNEAGFHMWIYSPYVASTGEPAMVVYLSSTDGIHWEKPALNIYEVRGYTTTNAVKSFPHYFDPVVKQYVTYNSEFFQSVSGNLYRATSPDGIHWPSDLGDLVRNTPVDCPFAPVLDSFLPDGSGWLLSRGPREESPIAPQYGNRRLYRWSYDGPQRKFVVDPVLILDAPHYPNDQMYYWSHVKIGNRYYGLASIYNRKVADNPEQFPINGPDDDTMNFYMAVSTSPTETNSWRWVAPGVPLVPRGPEGAWDSMRIYPLMTPNPIIIDDHLWVYYVGAAARHNDRMRGGTDPSYFRNYASSGIGLMRIPLADLEAMRPTK